MAGARVWQQQALPKIHAYYAQVLQDFSTNDTIHAIHYLLSMLNRMRQLDTPDGETDERV